MNCWSTIPSATQHNRKKTSKQSRKSNLLLTVPHSGKQCLIQSIHSSNNRTTCLLRLKRPTALFSCHLLKACIVLGCYPTVEGPFISQTRQSQFTPASTKGKTMSPTYKGTFGGTSLLSLAPRVDGTSEKKTAARLWRKAPPNDNMRFSFCYRVEMGFIGKAARLEEPFQLSK